MSDIGPPVVFLLPSLAHGGAQKVFLEIVSFLADEGKRVLLVSLDKQGGLLSRIPGNVNVIFLDHGLNCNGVLKRAIQWVRLRRLLNEKRVTCVYSTVTGMNIFTLSCFFLNKNIDITVREANSLENTSSFFILSLIRFLYPRANKIVCTSDYVRTQLLAFRGVKSKRVEVLPNPVDMGRIRSYAKISEGCCEIKSEGDYSIVTVGRLVKQKGFDVLLEALAIARKRDDIHLVIVGDGPQKLNLESIIHRLGLEGAVSLVGYQSNPYPYVANSDLFVLSSRWEGYVNVVIEAMVLGIDVVATDCKSGPGDMLKNELDYTLVPVDSPEALALAIRDVLLNPRDTSKFDRLLKSHELPIAVKHYMEVGSDICLDN